LVFLTLVIEWIRSLWPDDRTNPSPRFAEKLERLFVDGCDGESSLTILHSSASQVLEVLRNNIVDSFSCNVNFLPIFWARSTFVETVTLFRRHQFQSAVADGKRHQKWKNYNIFSHLVCSTAKLLEGSLWRHDKT
jgi:hypothetical protein